MGNEPKTIPLTDPMAEAYGLIHGDRKVDYGNVEASYQDVADSWTALLRTAGVLPRDQKLTPALTLLMMTALKLQRQANRPKRDNVVDGHGYLALHGQIVGA